MRGEEREREREREGKKRNTKQTHGGHFVVMETFNGCFFLKFSNFEQNCQQFSDFFLRLSKQSLCRSVKYGRLVLKGNRLIIFVYVVHSLTNLLTHSPIHPPAQPFAH